MDFQVELGLTKISKMLVLRSTWSKTEGLWRDVYEGVLSFFTSYFIS